MPHAIKMSEEFIETIRNLRKVTKVFDKNELLFFSDAEKNPMISCMDSGALVHIKGTPSHASYEGIAEFGVPNLTEFLDYIKALDYPNGRIDILSETSTKGKDLTVLCLQMITSYRMIIADPTKFELQDKKAPARARFYATCCHTILTTDDLKQTINDMLRKLQPDTGFKV